MVYKRLHTHVKNEDNQYIVLEVFSEDASNVRISLEDNELCFCNLHELIIALEELEQSTITL